MRVLVVCFWLVGAAVAVQAQVDAKAVLAEARELARAGRHAEAIERYQGLAEAVEAQLGGQSLALIFVLRELAEQHHVLGDAAAAEPLYRRSLLIGEENPEAEPAMLVPSLRGLAALAAGRGQLMEAEAFYQRALKVLEDSGVGSRPDVARVLAELGLLSQLQGRVREAESLYRRALAVGESSQLPALELATIVNNLGAVCAAQDRAAEAEPLDRGAAAETSEGCRHALQVHREMAGRLGLEPMASDPLSAPGLAATATRDEVDVAGPDRVFRAQIGSQRDRQLAEQALEELRQAHPLVSGLRFRIVRADLEDRGVWYRMQLGEFPTGAQAQALCRELARLGHDGCFVTVTPD